MSTVEVKVPNIGDFKDVEIIEVMVKPGDTIKVDQSLVTVESDKASMEIPSTHAGVVQELKIKVGDKVNEGSLLLTVSADGAGAVAAPAAAAPAAAPAAAAADQKSVTQIAKEMTELSLQAREGKLKPTDMQGATFTISSLGGIGGTAFTPIINAPEVAILGLSKSAMKPVWDGSTFQPRLMLPLSLSYDHRVIDGAGAARFAAYLADVLADLRKTLL